MFAKLVHRSVEQCLGGRAGMSNVAAWNLSLFEGIVDELVLRADQSLQIMQMAHQSVSWIGGAMFQKDIFRFVFVGLHGLRAVGALHRSIKSEFSGSDLLRFAVWHRVDQSLLNAKEAIAGAETHPLIRNLLLDFSDC